MTKHQIGPQHLSIKDAFRFSMPGNEIHLSEEAVKRVKACRDYLDQKIREGSETYYGINTGFGSLCDVRISPHELEKLQENLVRSHAAGVGETIPVEISRLILFLKIQSLSYGNSGISPETLERLIFFYNNDIIPVIYEYGSLGASGDLAPLAHLSLTLLGEGEVIHDGERKETSQILNKFSLKPLTLKAKEGLALLNGTQFMSAFGTWCTIEGQRTLRIANKISSLSLEGYDGKTEPFNPLIHQARKQTGQLIVASEILHILEGSEIATSEKKQVQDPYSFRCIPQVHGATHDVIDHVAGIFEKEINGVTDNPNIFPEEDLILSGGNFHGQPLAMALDYLAIGLSELGSISERRTFKLLMGERGLPAFLVARPGVNSGLMIPQYTAAGLCSQNKQLCTPGSADSIPSSNGQEDHVSMGANCALKTYKVLNNLKNILAIELLTASQALDFRRPLKSSKDLEDLMNEYRKVVPFVENDRVMEGDIRKSRGFIERL